MASKPFALAILETEPWLGLWSSYFMLPAVAGVTGMDHHIQLFSDEMEFYEIFCSG
jgi:hypothetical protein